MGAWGERPGLCVEKRLSWLSECSMMFGCMQYRNGEGTCVIFHSVSWKYPPIIWLNVKSIFLIGYCHNPRHFVIQNLFQRFDTNLWYNPDNPTLSQNKSILIQDQSILIQVLFNNEVTKYPER